jgi:hypothetical protein
LTCDDFNGAEFEVLYSDSFDKKMPPINKEALYLGKVQTWVILL